jgi:hypothetical protein
MNAGKGSKIFAQTIKKFKPEVTSVRILQDIVVPEAGT